jgi:hypothetical protein
LKFSPLEAEPKSFELESAPAFSQGFDACVFQSPWLTKFGDELVLAGDFCSLRVSMALNRKADSRPFGHRPSDSYDRPETGKPMNFRGLSLAFQSFKPLRIQTAILTLLGMGANPFSPVDVAVNGFDPGKMKGVGDHHTGIAG